MQLRQEHSSNVRYNVRYDVRFMLGIMLGIWDRGIAPNPLKHEPTEKVQNVKWINSGFR